MDTVTIIWLDGKNQERHKTVRRRVRDMPFKVYKQKRWPSNYTHMIQYRGAMLPVCRDRAGQWWAMADDTIRDA